MRTITYAEFGGPEVLQISELDVPSPGPGQIRVAVRAAGVNPYDWKQRRGFYGGSLPGRVGTDFAGVVDALGEGVSDVAVGDAVYGWGVDGTAAEYTLSTAYAPIPAGLDFVAAAALPVPVETAYRTLDLVGVAAGTTVLINGASGAVGQAAIQIAVDRGAHVIGTASEVNHELLRRLGAEPTTYGEGLADRVRALGVSRLDSAIDAAGGGVLPVLVELTGGTEHVVTVADYPGAEETGVTFSGGGADRALYSLTAVGDLIAAGRFSLPVARTFALEEIAAAHELSETGHPGGKLVLAL